MAVRDRALLGTPPKIMTIADFLAGGGVIDDIPGKYLVGVAPRGMSEPVEVADSELAPLGIGYFYDVELRSYGICNSSNWVLIAKGGSIGIGIQTVKHGESTATWDVLIARKPGCGYYTDHLPASEMGRDEVIEMLESVGPYVEFSVHIGSNPGQLIERKIMFDSDAEDNGFCRSADYTGDPSGYGLLADAMANDAAFNSLASLIWFDAETIRCHAPKFYHAQEHILSVGDYALTKLSRIVRVVTIDADGMKCVPANQPDDYLSTKYTRRDSLVKLDGELVERLLNLTENDESESK